MLNAVLCVMWCWLGYVLYNRFNVLFVKFTKDCPMSVCLPHTQLEEDVPTIGVAKIILTRFIEVRLRISVTVGPIPSVNGTIYMSGLCQGLGLRLQVPLSPCGLPVRSLVYRVKVPPGWHPWQACIHRRRVPIVVTLKERTASPLEES